ncbi:hypothetical protein COCMIDRAFT_37883 [Bipolaris oryzae ATCC 44560]|uniref:Uncharacterized protein n=1 Tax=Bipolaris oryzae ATCC 44560 TaxID=930090 RepID=W6Z2S7_COCMI|nr:uncharacterized protein COCMIDRAFT_37883 [Bipolaris oryzae ATCC 44560]EUC44235.1 hypothetical protein COCMIDRAFT_37883 [Bipolaris oryzae ATCC 44560]
MENKLSAAETQLAEASSTHNETCKALQAAQKGKQEAVENLAKERFTYSKALEVAQRGRQNAAEKLAREQVIYHTARDELGTLRNTLNSTLAELASAHKTIESQATGLTTLQAEVHRLQACLDTLEEQRKQEALVHQSWVRQSLTTSSVSIAETRNLQEQVSSMRQRCDLWYGMYRSTHTNMEKQIADMSSAMIAAHAENFELFSLKEELERAVAKLQTKVEGLEDDNALLRDEKWRLEGEWQNLTVELAEYKESNRKLVGKWWKAVMANEVEDEERKEEEKEKKKREKILRYMLYSRLDTAIERQLGLRAAGVQEQEVNNEKEEQQGQEEDEVEDDDGEEYDDMESSEDDEEFDEDEDEVESLDGSETSEAPETPSAIPVVQLYWETNIVEGNHENDVDEEDEYDEYYEEEYYEDEYYEEDYEYEYVEEYECVEEYEYVDECEYAGEHVGEHVDGADH